jgi:hypothetical protein
MAEQTFTCKRCGAVTREPGHLCEPCGDNKTCAFCGATDTGPRHVCKKKIEAMAFVCDGCGRVATEADLLCKPKAIY